MTTVTAEAPRAVKPTSPIESASADQPASVAGGAAEPSVGRRPLCDRCRCPRYEGQAGAAAGPSESLDSCEELASHEAPGLLGVGDEATEESAPREQLTALLPALRDHPNLDYTTLAYHAGQCDATARDGYFHAAINEARAFLETLVINIALAEERPPNEAIADFRKRRESYCGFPSCTRYLQEIGLFNLDERVMVQHAYTLDHAGSIRQGISSEAWSHLVRRMVWAAGQYVIQRYEAWKCGCGCYGRRAEVDPGSACPRLARDPPSGRRVHQRASCRPAGPQRASGQCHGVALPRRVRSRHATRIAGCKAPRSRPRACDLLVSSLRAKVHSARRWTL